MYILWQVFLTEDIRTLLGYDYKFREVGLCTEFMQIMCITFKNYAQNLCKLCASLLRIVHAVFANY